MNGHAWCSPPTACSFPFSLGCGCSLAAAFATPSAGDRDGSDALSVLLSLICSIMPSRRLNRESNSGSCCRLCLRGALPGAGKTHSIPALIQFEHGDRLLQRTFLRRHVTQLCEFKCSCDNCETALGLEATLKLPDKLLGCSGPALVEVCDGGFRGADSSGWNGMIAYYRPSGTYFTRFHE